MCVVSVCVAATLREPTVEKRRVLSRVRRGALYLSHRRVSAEPGPNVPQTEFAARNTRAERTPLTVTKNRCCCRACRGVSRSAVRSMRGRCPLALRRVASVPLCVCARVASVAVVSLCTRRS